jgi:hypothetical protein
VYVKLLDDLLNVLKQCNCGVATTTHCPVVWQGNRWAGNGTPVQQWTEETAIRIICGLELPTIEALAADIHLEASMLPSIDILDGSRIAMAGHADDPIFLAFSAGKLQRMIPIVASWCFQHGAEVHVARSKTVAFRAGGHGECPQLVFTNLCSGLSSTIEEGRVKKWLGWMWCPTCGAAETLHARVTVACCAFASLKGFIQAGAVPLPLGLPLFHAKVDGALAFGRALYCIAPDAAEKLDALEVMWAKGLVGAPPWANGAACRLKLDSF